MAFFTTSDGKRLFYEDSGTGSPLICLAGLTRTGGDFRYLAPLVTDLRMITMDYRGRGQSDYDPEYLNYNIFREAEDVIELMDHLGLQRATILGTSRGGLIAMALAASHVERLRHVILNDGGPVIEATGIAQILDNIGRRPRWKTHEEAAQALAKLTEAAFPGVPLERWHEQAMVQFEQSDTGLALRYGPALRTALMEQVAAGPPADLWPLFDALRDIPTGVIRGANSDLLSPATVAEMHNRHPDLLSAEVPDRGHVPFLDEAEEIELIRTILRAA
jgi:pimeloyl-ACP methyl ester carboxylesterase